MSNIGDTNLPISNESFFDDEYLPSLNNLEIKLKLLCKNIDAKQEIDKLSERMFRLIKINEDLDESYYNFFDAKQKYDEFQKSKNNPIDLSSIQDAFSNNQRLLLIQNNNYEVESDNLSKIVKEKQEKLIKTKIKTIENEIDEIINIINDYLNKLEENKTNIERNYINQVKKNVLINEIINTIPKIKRKINKLDYLKNIINKLSISAEYDNIRNKVKTEQDEFNKKIKELNNFLNYKLSIDNTNTENISDTTIDYEKLNKLIEENQKNKDDMEYFHDQLEEKKNENKYLKEQLEIKVKENDKFSEQSNNLNSENERLKKEMQKLKDDFIKQDEQSKNENETEMQKLKDDFFKQNEQLKKENETLKIEMQKLKDDFFKQDEQLKNENATLKIKMQKLKEDLDYEDEQSKNENERLKKEIQQLKKDLDYEDEESKKLTEENKKLQTIIYTLFDKIRNLE